MLWRVGDFGVQGGRSSEPNESKLGDRVVKYIIQNKAVSGASRLLGQNGEQKPELSVNVDGGQWTRYI